jgi:hypothetical protein
MWFSFNSFEMSANFLRTGLHHSPEDSSLEDSEFQLVVRVLNSKLETIFSHPWKGIGEMMHLYLCLLPFHVSNTISRYSTLLSITTLWEYISNILSRSQVYLTISAFPVHWTLTHGAQFPVDIVLVQAFGRCMMLNANGICCLKDRFPFIDDSAFFWRTKQLSKTKFLKLWIACYNVECRPVLKTSLKHNCIHAYFLKSQEVHHICYRRFLETYLQPTKYTTKFVVYL